jgi:hypothetical protein
MGSKNMHGQAKLDRLQRAKHKARKKQERKDARRAQKQALVKPSAGAPMR